MPDSDHEPVMILIQRIIPTSCLLAFAAQSPLPDELIDGFDHLPGIRSRQTDSRFGLDEETAGSCRQENQVINR